MKIINLVLPIELPRPRRASKNIDRANHLEIRIDLIQSTRQQLGHDGAIAAEYQSANQVLSTTDSVHGLHQHTASITQDAMHNWELNQRFTGIVKSAKEYIDITHINVNYQTEARQI